MKKIFFLLAGLSATQLAAANNDQLAAIDGMGQLNGVALQCRYIEQVRMIKMSLVKNLPKERMLGQRFEQSTNQSFMDFMAKEQVCPSADSFNQELDAAIQKLEAAFSQ